MTKLIVDRSIVLLFLPLLLVGCQPAQSTQPSISISISADQKKFHVVLPAGSTTQEALNSVRITLGELDEVEPGKSTVLSNASKVIVTRVKEEFYTEQIILPFEHQEMKNEALPEGDRRLSQAGENGLKEITYRRLFEDGLEVSNSLVKSEIIKAAVPEVEMLGTRPQYAAMAIPGKIAYLSAGNAWMIENTTADRQLVVATGDLDGRVFSLSKDGKFLLFSRHSDEVNTINTLWLASLMTNPIQIIALPVKNIVHFAEFNPASNIIAYSTAEWREALPGWQANNDLYEIKVSDSGSVSTSVQILATGTGGVYGWWGTNFEWSPDQVHFLYSRPDSLGIVSLRDQTQTSLVDIIPYQTSGNWAWVPEAAWSPAGNVIYSVSHAITGTLDAATSSVFNIVAVPLTEGSPVSLVSNVGMFAHPVPSPLVKFTSQIEPISGKSVEQADFMVAYLQAMIPEQSETSAYRLFIMDRDGSNRKALFPEAAAEGLSPQRVAWSPASLGAGANYAIALVYSANIWIIEAGTGKAHQITGDGLTSRLDWR